MRRTVFACSGPHGKELTPPMTAVKGNPATVRFRILGDGPVPIWGLSSRERLRRQLKEAGVTQEAGGPAGQGPGIILLHAGYVYDQRIIAGLATASNSVLEVDEGGRRRPVAASVDADVAAATERLLLEEATGAETESLRRLTPETISGAYVEELLKSEVPILLPIRAEDRARIERRLFDGSYKGVTDVVTKYVWPLPARWATRFCSVTGIRPNHVTFCGLAFVIFATALFAYGWYGTGLILAWLMTFFDTVDGKLARVTIDSSRLGHALDKGVDIIHPPIWYIAWGLGLPLQLAPSESDMTLVLGAVVGGYILGRLAEGAFTLFLGGFSMFTWRPFDSRFRLVLARRNPCLIVLSVAWLVGRPDWGLMAVAVWTVLSAVVLLGRFFQALYERLTSGPLNPWLQAPHPVTVGEAGLGGVGSPSGRIA